MTAEGGAVSLEEIKTRLKPLVAECVMHGEFTLASGKKSDFYFDGRLVTLSAEGLYFTAEAILEMISGREIAAVGSIPVGADPMTGATVSLAGKRGLALSGFLVRKEPKKHGTGKQVEGPRPPAGSRVVLLEDTITTGGSVIRGIEALRREWPEVTLAAVVVLVDRLEGGREAIESAGVELWPIFTREDFDARAG
jgi:orotate phosphoribosyltransferase